MTGQEESHSSTRPISVAELLAKNGTIGAPPVGGRRRRRRGNSDSVTVAELTGEIPIISDAPHRDAAEPATDELEEVREDYAGPLSSNGIAGHVEEDEEADYAAHIEEREAEPLFAEPPRRPKYGYSQRSYQASTGVGAEGMSPDPVDVDDDDAVEALAADTTRPAMAKATAPDVEDDADELPSYLRASGGTLFGGETVADDLARRRSPRYDDLDDTDVEHDEDDLDFDHETTMSSFARGALVVGQCIVAVLFGAGLFIAFDQLWKWNNIVALVLSVLVILGLVVGVRVVRKTEDIGSTLIAVAVGALVTLGPLALLQSG
jgi:F0F1-type ATP synthase assembly protein I